MHAKTRTRKDGQPDKRYHRTEISNLPDGIHPLIREAFTIAAGMGHTMKSAAELSGTPPATAEMWRIKRSNPRIDYFEAFLNGLGKKLKIVDKDEE